MTAQDVGTQDTVKPRSFIYYVAIYVAATAVMVAGLWGGAQLGQLLGGRVLWFLLAVIGGFGSAVLVIWSSVSATGRFQGGHAAVSFVLAFTTIITANVLLATNAVSTFPGVETDNSYIASQTFDKRRAVQEALGWHVAARNTGGLLILEIKDQSGRPVQVADLHATLGRPTHVKDDQNPDFRFDGSAYVAKLSLAPGNWNIRMTARAEDGSAFEQRVVFHVQP